MKRIFIAFTVLIFTGCTSAKIALDNNWINPVEYAVKGRQGLLINQQLSFAEYKTTQVKRSWTKESAFSSGWAKRNPAGDITNRISMEYVSKNQTIHFSLADGKGAESDVFCVSNMEATSLVIGNNPNSIMSVMTEINMGDQRGRNNYYVQLYRNGSDKPWEMLVDNEAAEVSPSSYRGLLAQSKSNYFTIVPINRLAGKNGKPTGLPMRGIGFEFRDKDNNPVAAVSLIDAGIVYLQNADEATRFLLANACAALLLQEKI